MVRLCGMKRVIPSITNLSAHPLAAGLALLAMLGCSAGESDETPDFEYTPVSGGSGPVSPQTGVGGQSASVGGNSGSGAVGNATEGQGGSIPLGNGGSGGTGAGVGA